MLHREAHVSSYWNKTSWSVRIKCKIQKWLEGKKSWRADTCGLLHSLARSISVLKTDKNKKKLSNIFKGILSHNGCLYTACEWPFFIYLFCSCVGLCCSMEKLHQALINGANCCIFSLSRMWGNSSSFATHRNLTLPPLLSHSSNFFHSTSKPKCSCRWLCSTTLTKCPVIPEHHWKHWHSDSRYQHSLITVSACSCCRKRGVSCHLGATQKKVTWDSAFSRQDLCISKTKTPTSSTPSCSQPPFIGAQSQVKIWNEIQILSHW